MRTTSRHGYRWPGQSTASPLLLNAVGAVVLALAGLGAYGAYSHFLPSKTWTDIRGFVVWPLTIGSTIALYWAWTTGRYVPATTAAQKWIVALSAPPILFAVFWMSVGVAIPDIIVRTTGTDQLVTASLRKEFSVRPKRCDYRVTGAELMRGPPGYLCIPEGRYRELPEAGDWLLAGKGGALGFHVIDVRLPSEAGLPAARGAPATR